MLTQLSGLDELEAAIQESIERPALHQAQPHCGVSCEALDELHEHVSQAGTPAAYKLTTVQSHRQLSGRAAERLGVRHETPQAILLRDGRSVWKASHFRITARALSQALES